MASFGREIIAKLCYNPSKEQPLSSAGHPARKDQMKPPSNLLAALLVVALLAGCYWVIAKAVVDHEPIRNPSKKLLIALVGLALVGALIR